MTVPNAVYQLKVTLDDSKPPIWRRILVSENITLHDLHEIIQRVMGWHNYHLHMFRISGQIYGDPEEDETGMLGTKNEARYRISQFGLREKSKFSYEYDFGDGWEHTLLVEKITSPDPSAHYPICVAGKRACPPEDVGGIWGYADFLEAMADSAHEEHDEMLEWAGGEFDPERFDLDKVNKALRVIQPARGRHKAQREEEAETDDDLMPPTPQGQKVMADALTAWVQNLNREQFDALDSLPLRRDMLTFLDYLAKNRTVGTQSTGNLPLKAVRGICEKFVKPLVLDQTIDGHSYKVHSEDEVFPLLFLHSLAFHSGMVTGGQVKTWKVTSEGQLFPQLPPPIQVYFLIANWWTQIDWTIAFPVSGLADGLPLLFKPSASACLRELPPGEYAPFETFADHLIAQSGLTWPSKDQTNVRAILRSVIKRVVVDMMNLFGVLECEYVPENSTGSQYSKLANIRLTPIGKGLLDLLK